MSIVTHKRKEVNEMSYPSKLAKLQLAVTMMVLTACVAPSTTTPSIPPLTNAPLDTLAPTDTPVPTSTTALTSTAEPTATPTITPTPGPVIVSDYAGPVPTNALARLGKGFIIGMSYTPNGQSLVIGTRIGVYLYQANTLKQMWYAQNYDTETIAISTDGTLIASSSHSAVILLDAATGNPVRTLESQLDPRELDSRIVSLTFSPKGNLAALAASGEVIIWNTSQEQPLHTIKGDTWAAGYSPDGNLLMLGSDNGTVILLNTDTYQPAQTFQAHTEGISSAAFSPHGDMLALGLFDGTIILWDITSTKSIYTHGTLLWSASGCLLARRQTTGIQWLF